MKILLDNCIDVRAKRLFAPHEVSHAVDHGWGALTNGRLFAAAAAAGFELLVTVDKNIRHQHNLRTLPVAVLELELHRNRLAELVALSPHFPAALEKVPNFRLVSLKPDGRIECLEPR